MTFDRAMWALAWAVSFAAAVAVTFFNWEPPPRVVAMAAFWALCYAAGARFFQSGKGL